MPPTVQLKDILDALEMQLDEYSSWLDLDAGRVETVHDSVLRHAEASEEGEPPDLPEWQLESWDVARRIVSTDRFIALPSKFDVHEWSIMRDFTRSVESESIRNEMEYAIHGAGAFRHFKTVIRRHGMEPAWFAFRAAALQRIAVEWCEAHKIAWR